MHDECAADGHDQQAQRQGSIHLTPPRKSSLMNAQVTRWARASVRVTFAGWQAQVCACDGCVFFLPGEKKTERT
jgi:hypothetical protein